MAQFVMIKQILIAECHAEHPLADHRRHRMLDLIRRSAVAEAPRKPLDQPDGPVGRPQQQPAGVRRELAAIKCGDHRAPLDTFKSEQIGATLCRHRAPP
jgi:hypothetical protein